MVVFRRNDCLRSLIAVSDPDFFQTLNLEIFWLIVWPLRILLLHPCCKTIRQQEAANVVWETLGDAA